MRDPRAFCRTVMHEYERQWSRATGHGVRHPLRLKMDMLAAWCEVTSSSEDFEARLIAGEASEDPRAALLAGELLPLWRSVARGGRLPNSDDG